MKKHNTTSSKNAQQTLNQGNPKALLVAAFFLFLSGISALVFQVLWIKQLSVVVGVDVHAISIAISAFFAGLAFGSYIFGRRADELKKPLNLYVYLEIGIAILGVAVSLALPRSAALFVSLEASIGILAWLLPFLLVASPAFLMGGTLPVLVRALSPTKNNLSKVGGVLYAANTTGAIVGALLTSFMLIEAYGVFGASLFAGIINILVATGAWLYLKSFVYEESLQNNKRVEHHKGAVLALCLYAIAGGIAMGYEVVWSQVIVQWTSTRTFAFSIVLATYLLGLVIGSALFSRKADKFKDPWSVFGFLIVAAGVTALITLEVSGDWLSTIQGNVGDYFFNAYHNENIARVASFLVVSFWLILLPTIFLGAAFPAALRLIVSPENAGQDTGQIVAFNTIGGILGTTCVGFILVPWLGVEYSLIVLALSAACVGLIAIFKGNGIQKKGKQLVFATVALTIIATLFMPSDYLAQRLVTSKGGTLVYQEPSAAGTVAILEQSKGTHRFRRLYISGVSNSGNSMTSQRYMRLQALLPLLITKSEPKSALVIGLGTGITTGSLLYYPGLEKRVCAELLPEVIRAAGQFSGNNQVTTDPRVDIRVLDGRRELLRSKEQYDLITLEPPPPSAAGVVNLYSSDFYQLSAKRLHKDGIVAQWLPLPTQTDKDTRSLVKSFIDVFPYASVWTTEFHEMLLVGSLNPMELDVTKITERFNQPTVSKALSEVGVKTPSELFATWITDRKGLEAYAGHALPTTDNHPRIEYGDWPLPGQFTKSIIALNNLYKVPPLIHADEALFKAIETDREILLRFYEASIYAYQGNQKRWKQALDWVKKYEPNNPYYNWIIGEN